MMVPLDEAKDGRCGATLGSDSDDSPHGSA